GDAVRRGRAPERLGSGHPTMVPYRNYKGSDGRYFFAAAFTPKFWQNLCQALDRPDLPTDPRFLDNRARTANREALDAILESIFRQQPAAYWVDRLATRDVPCALVQDYHTALTEDPQVRHNGAVLHFDHPVAGAMTNIANPVNFHGSPAQVRRPPPVLGQHTREVLLEKGFSAHEVDELMRDKTVFGSRVDVAEADAGVLR
ncbi:MAG TPA: CoA transferase, partial [Ramlibacter sp.]